MHSEIQSGSAAFLALLSSRCLLIRACATENQLLQGGNSISLWKGLHDEAACSVRGLDSLTQASSQSQHLNGINQPFFSPREYEKLRRSKQYVFSVCCLQKTSLRASDSQIKDIATPQASTPPPPPVSQTHQQPKADTELPTVHVPPIFPIFPCKNAQTVTTYSGTLQFKHPLSQVVTNPSLFAANEAAFPCLLLTDLSSSAIWDRV